MREVRRYEEGLDGWEKAGLPVPASPGVHEHLPGPVHDCRPIVVNRAKAYGGAFPHSTTGVEGAGG